MIPGYREIKTPHGIELVKESELRVLKKELVKESELRVLKKQPQVQKMEERKARTNSRNTLFKMHSTVEICSFIIFCAALIAYVTYRDANPADFTVPGRVIHAAWLLIVYTPVLTIVRASREKSKILVEEMQDKVST